MTNRTNQRVREFVRDELMSPFTQQLDGVTGKLGDDDVPLSNASIGLEQGLTWVRLDGGRDAAAVLNGVVNPISPGVPVHTAKNRRTGVREIVRGNFAEAVRLYGEDVARRMMVPLPLLFEAEALLIGKTEPSELGGMFIYVRRAVHDLTEFIGEHYDLSSVVAGMSANSQLMVLTGVDEASNAVSVTAGAEKSQAYVFTQSDADEIALPAGVVPSAALALRAGQTEAADSFTLNPRRCFDRRQFLNIASGTATRFDDIVVDHHGQVVADRHGYVVVSH